VECSTCFDRIRAPKIRTTGTWKSWFRDFIHAQHESRNSSLGGGKGITDAIRRPKKYVAQGVESGIEMEEEEQEKIKSAANLLV
jgi:hypothetical protein